MHLASKCLALTGLLVAASAAACGGGGSTGTGGSKTTGASGGSTGTAMTGTGGGASAAMACADQAKAVCMEREKCSTASFDNKQVYGDEPTCEMRVGLTCVGNLSAKGTGQTPTRIEGCVAEYGSYACADFRDGNPPGACVPPAGTQAAGMPCGVPAQCASTFCEIPQYQVCGTCAALPVAGATCQVGADCGRDLACATATGATMGTCAAFVAAGGACLTGVAPCEAGLACVGDDEAAKTMGMCVAQGATTGALCDGARKAMANCDGFHGLVCIPSAKGSTVGTCQSVTLVAAGATCGDIGAAPITGFAVCEAGGLCVKAAPTDTTGTCKAPASDGTACDNDATKGPPCLAPARCVPGSSTSTAGTCMLNDATKCN